MLNDRYEMKAFLIAKGFHTSIGSDNSIIKYPISIYDKENDIPLVGLRHTISNWLNDVKLTVVMIKNAGYKFEPMDLRNLDFVNPVKKSIGERIEAKIMIDPAGYENDVSMDGRVSKRPFLVKEKLDPPLIIECPVGTYMKDVAATMIHFQ